MKKILLLAFIFAISFSWTYAFDCGGYETPESMARYAWKNKIRQAANKLNQIVFDKWLLIEGTIRSMINQSNMTDTYKTYLYNLVVNKPGFIRNIDIMNGKVYIDIDWAYYGDITNCNDDFYGSITNNTTKTRRYEISRSATIGWYDVFQWNIYGIISMDDTEYYDDIGNYHVGKQCTMWTFIDNAYKMCNGSFREYTDFHYWLCDSTEYLQTSPGSSICGSNKTIPLTYLSFDLDQYAIAAIWSIYTE